MSRKRKKIITKWSCHYSDLLEAEKTEGNS
jgi:hypothetical protein